jgi:hypothetical protein
MGRVSLYLVDTEIVADTERGLLSCSLQFLPRVFGRLRPVRREVKGSVEMILRNLDFLAGHLKSVQRNINDKLTGTMDNLRN